MSIGPTMYFTASRRDAQTALQELRHLSAATDLYSDALYSLEAVAEKPGLGDTMEDLRLNAHLGHDFCRWLESASYRAAQEGRVDVAAALGRLRASARL